MHVRFFLAFNVRRQRSYVPLSIHPHFLLAPFAKPIELKFVAMDLELVLFRHKQLKLLDLLVLELDDPAAMVQIR